jgi:hypothetical protein
VRVGRARLLRWAAVAAALVLAGGTAGGAAGALDPPDERAAAPAYLTLLFSRSQWATADGCTRLPNTVTLQALAAELQRRALPATGTVVTRQVRPSSRLCLDDLDVNGNVVHPGGVLYGSWADLGNLRRNNGWTFVSHSRTYRTMTTLTPAEQRAEACGSIADLRGRGHLRGDGLFAYPNNFWTDAVQRDVVATCFAFGRIYGSAPNDRATTGPPWFQRTVSVNGGNCNVTTLPCYTFTAPRRYTSPVSLGDRIARLGPDQWFVMQHYRFVTGQVAGRWDCRAADWRRHWTGSAEEYCWNDYRSILDRIPSTTVVTDPKTVAVAWGRTDY